MYVSVDTYEACGSFLFLDILDSLFALSNVRVEDIQTRWKVRRSETLFKRLDATISLNSLFYCPECPNYLKNGPNKTIQFVFAPLLCRIQMPGVDRIKNECLTKGSLQLVGSAVSDRETTSDHSLNADQSGFVLAYTARDERNSLIAKVFEIEISCTFIMLREASLNNWNFDGSKDDLILDFMAFVVIISPNCQSASVIADFVNENEEYLPMCSKMIRSQRFGHLCLPTEHIL